MRNVKTISIKKFSPNTCICITIENSLKKEKKALDIIFEHDHLNRLGGRAKEKVW